MFFPFKSGICCHGVLGNLRNKLCLNYHIELPPKNDFILVGNINIHIFVASTVPHTKLKLSNN